ncbi:MAG: hypothetical protein LBI31_02095 [Zoogloeaceae bacterium]|nr:hypothetical protein [Zoogloeaceae bacterium]
MKLYKNMVCTSITTTQDKNSSAILCFKAHLREVIIVNTEIVRYPPREPGKTSRQADKKQERGTQQGKPATEADKKKPRSITSAVTGVKPKNA